MIIYSLLGILFLIFYIILGTVVNAKDEDERSSIFWVLITINLLSMLAGAAVLIIATK